MDVDRTRASLAISLQAIMRLTEIRARRPGRIPFARMRAGPVRACF